MGESGKDELLVGSEDRGNVKSKKLGSMKSVYCSENLDTSSSVLSFKFAPLTFLP